MNVTAGQMPGPKERGDITPTAGEKQHLRGLLVQLRRAINR
jgi:hypothetical protein